MKHTKRRVTRSVAQYIREQKALIRHRGDDAMAQAETIRTLEARFIKTPPQKL